MAEAWFRKMGFGRNPFSIKPAAFGYELFGVDVDAVLSAIGDGKVLFIEAPLGYGKTTLLKGIIHRFGGRKKVIYANALPSEKVDVKSLLKHSSISNYITGNLPREMILVVDEAQNIVPETAAEIAEFYKSGNIMAVVFFGTKYNRQSFVSGLNELMNGNVMQLLKPTPEQAVSLVRNRIGNLQILSSEAILSAYQRANGSPRRLLQLCEDLCRAAIARNKLSVSEQELSELAPAKTTASAESKKRPKTKAARPRIAGEKMQQKKVRRQRRAKRQKQATQRKHPSKQSKQPRPPAPQPSSSVKYTTSATATDAAEGTEGIYWGEFMGMQK